jgi:hypothetical protein
VLTFNAEDAEDFAEDAEKHNAEEVAAGGARMCADQTEKKEQVLF